MMACVKVETCSLADAVYDTKLAEEAGSMKSFA